MLHLEMVRRKVQGMTHFVIWALEQGIHADVVELCAPQVTAWLAALFSSDFLSLTKADGGQELPLGSKDKLINRWLLKNFLDSSLERTQ